MKARILLFLFITINPAVFGATQENSDPVQIFEGLRRQMKELDTLRANYIVDTTFGLSNKNIQYKVSYIKSGDKFNISETAYDGVELIQENKYVYDGINVRDFHFLKKINKKVGSIHPKSFKEAIFQNNICDLAGFSINKTNAEKNLEKSVFKNMGKEDIDGHECVKILAISPYKPKQNAYIYRWIEIRDKKYYYTKAVCLIENNPNQLLYQKQFDYNYSDVYPLPRKIYYERFEIDDKGNRTPSYKLNVVVEDMQVNIPVADSEFVYFFPEGTLVDITSASIDPEKITDPNWPNTAKTPKNITEVKQPSQDDRTKFPIGGGSGAILLPVNIQGQEYLFVLDTGSSHTAFDASLRDILGKPRKIVKAGTPANPMIVQIFESPTVRIGLLVCKRATR